MCKREWVWVLILEDYIKGKVAPVLNKAQRHEDVLGEWRYSSAYS